MLGRILRQWPRILLVTALFSVALLVMLALDPVHELGDYLNPVGILAVGLLSFATAAVLVTALNLLWPVGLVLAECMGLGAVIGVAAAAGPGESALPLWGGAMIFAVLVLALAFLIHGDWWPDSFRRDSGPRRYVIDTALPPERLWPMVHHLPGRLDAYIYPDTELVAAPEGSGADYLRRIPATLASLPPLEHLVHVEVFDPGCRVRYRMAWPDGRLFAAEELRLEPLPGGGTRLHTDYVIHGLTPGQRLGMALSLSLSDARASVRARLEGRRDWSLAGYRLRQKGG